MWLSRDDVVNTFPIRGPGTAECTRRVSLEDGEEGVDEGKLAVTRKPQKRGSVAVTQPGVLLKLELESLLGTRPTALSKSAQNAWLCSRVMDTVYLGPCATTEVIALDLPAKLKVIDIRRSFVSSCVHVASQMIDSLTASPTPCCPARPLLPSTPLQNTRYPAAANSVRPGLRVSCSPVTSQPSTLHFCKSTSARPAPRRPVRDNERTFQVATLTSPVRDHAHAAFCLILTLRRLSGRASPTFPS